MNHTVPKAFSRLRGHMGTIEAIVEVVTAYPRLDESFGFRACGWRFRM